MDTIEKLRTLALRAAATPGSILAEHSNGVMHQMQLVLHCPNPDKRWRDTRLMVSSDGSAILSVPHDVDGGPSYCHAVPADFSDVWRAMVAAVLDSEVDRLWALMSLPSE